MTEIIVLWLSWMYFMENIFDVANKKSQLTTEYLRPVFIIMLFVCATNPFPVICQFADKFIISFFSFTWWQNVSFSVYGGRCDHKKYGNWTTTKKETHRFQFRQFHTIQNAYLFAYGLKIGLCVFLWRRKLMRTTLGGRSHQCGAT